MNLIRLFFALLVATNGNTADLLVNLSPKNDYFIGRKAIFSDIDTAIEKTKSVLLFGTAGIGKSQIAKAYAWTKSSSYNFIWWINAGQPLYPQLIDFAEQWNQKLVENPIELSKNSQIMLQNIIENLSSTNDKGLIIIDDTHKTKDSDTSLQRIAEKNQHHIIQTTRNANVEQLSEENSHIKEFSRQESLLFLQKIRADKYKDGQELNALAVLLKDYPLSLAQAFTYLESAESVNVSQYIEAYKKKRDQLVAANDKIIKTTGKPFIDGYKLTTETTTTMTLEQIKKESLDAFYLAECLSLVANSDIPEQMILQLFEGDFIKTTHAIATLMYSNFKVGYILRQIRK